MKVELSQVTAVVLAGGVGTRVRHLLSGRPKPMAPVAGKPFLEWVVRYLARQGVIQVVISTGYKAEVTAQHFANAPVAGATVRCVAETHPLGTGGGFLHAARACGQSPPGWLVLNGDSLVFADLSAAARLLDEPGTAGVIIGRAVPEASRYGTLALGPDNSLRGFQEKRPGRGVISAGVYLLRPDLLREFPARLPLSFEKDVFPALTSRQACLKVQVVNAPFLDIGTPETLPQAESFIRQNRQQFL
ncbi:MAG: nucleotidyltransferase family protein [Verrucomicrobiota bacterium]|jgi:NDP-sugar pyrophosphorylase family protein